MEYGEHALANVEGVAEVVVLDVAVVASHGEEPLEHGVLLDLELLHHAGLFEHLVGGEYHLVLVEREVVEYVGAEALVGVIEARAVLLVVELVLIEEGGELALRTRGVIGEHLESHRLLGHALLQLIVDERVLDAQAAEDAERLEELLVVLVKRLIVLPVGDLRTADDGVLAIPDRHAQQALGLELPHGVDERVEARVLVRVRQVDLLARADHEVGQVARYLATVVLFHTSNDKKKKNLFVSNSK